MQAMCKTLLLVVSTLSFYQGWCQTYLKPEVHYLEGRAEFLPAGEIQWSNLSAQQKVDHNTTLRTANSSRSEFRFSNGWFFTMDEGSHIQYLFARGQDENQVSFSSLQGDLYFHIDQCQGCHNTRVSWYLDSNIIQATQADFSTSQKGKILHLNLYEGSMVIRRGKQVELIKAPQTVILQPKGIQKVPLSSNFGKDTLTAPKVEVAKVRTPPQNLRKSISFQVSQAYHLKSNKWDIPRFLLDWHKTYLDGLGVYFQTHEDKPFKDFYEVKMDVKEFALSTSSSSWSLMVEFEFVLVNPISQAIEDQWTFKKLYHGKASKEVDLRLLKYLPLDNRNQKIKDSFFEQLWNDYQKEVLERIVDPLYTPSDAVF